MISIPVYDKQGKPSGSVEIDPAVLGGEVRPPLLKQAIVMYHAGRRQNTSATKNRAGVEGSTKKLYRQKGTGNARAGARRTNIRRGGGVAFAKGRQVYRQGLNKKMRRLARNNAILAKATRQDVLVIEDFDCDAPNTKWLCSLLSAVDASRGCLVATESENRNLYLSGRNLQKTAVVPLESINAYDILRRKKLVFSRKAFDVLKENPEMLRAGDTPGASEG